MRDHYDEFTKEAFMIKVDRRLKSKGVIDALTDLFTLLGPRAFIRSENGPEFIAQAVRDLNAAVRSKTAYIELGLLSGLDSTGPTSDCEQV